jgi:hypothetical protein
MIEYIRNQSTIPSTTRGNIIAMYGHLNVNVSSSSLMTNRPSMIQSDPKNIVPQQHYAQPLFSTPQPDCTISQTDNKDVISQNHYEEVLYGSARDPSPVNVKPDSTTQHQQYVEVLHEADKPQILLELMLQLFKTEAKKMKILIFTNKMKTASLMEYLSICLVSGICPPVTGVIGSEKEQIFDRIIDSFRSSNNQILIISDGVFKDQNTCE